MCTALTYFDSSSRPYVGRTREFPVLLPSLLGNFATVAEARTALATQPVNATRIGILGNLPAPLHIMLTRLAGTTGLRLIPLDSLDPLGGDATDLLANRSA